MPATGIRTSSSLTCGLGRRTPRGRHAAAAVAVATAPADGGCRRRRVVLRAVVLLLALAAGRPGAAGAGRPAGPRPCRRARRADGLRGRPPLAAVAALRRGARLAVAAARRGRRARRGRGSRRPSAVSTGLGGLAPRAAVLGLDLGLGLRLGDGLDAAEADSGLPDGAVARRRRRSARPRAGRRWRRLARDVDLLLRGLLLGGAAAAVARARPWRWHGASAWPRRPRSGGALGRSRGTRLRPALLLDDLDQLALAHARGAPDAEAGRDLLQLGQDHAVEAGAGAAAPCGGARGSTCGGRGVVDRAVGSHAHQIGGVAHEGSFPGADVGLSGSATGCAVRLRPVILSITDRAGAVVRRVRRRDKSAWVPARDPPARPLPGRSVGCRAGSGACSKLLRQAAQAVGEALGRMAVPEGDTKHRATKTTDADLRLTLPDPTNIPPLVHRQAVLPAAVRYLRSERQDARARGVETAAGWRPTPPPQVRATLSAAPSVDQREHRRARAGDDRGDAVRAQPVDQGHALRHRRGAVLLVEPVLGGRRAAARGAWSGPRRAGRRGRRWPPRRRAERCAGAARGRSRSGPPCRARRPPERPGVRGVQPDRAGRVRRPSRRA